MLRVKTSNVFGSLWCEYEVNVGGIQWERKTLELEGCVRWQQHGIEGGVVTKCLGCVGLVGILDPIIFQSASFSK